MVSSRYLNGFLFAVLFGVLPLKGERPAEKMGGHLDGGETYLLEGNTRPVVVRGLARAEGRVSRGQKLSHMTLHFAMTAQQEADLTQLLAAQQDRRSPQFHKFLTPEEYAARFGVNPADLQRVSAWLEESGFTNLQAARGGRWVSFAGTAEQAEAAFHVALHRYSLRGEMHFANAGDPQLPKALSGIVTIRGLDNFAKKSQAKRRRSQYTSSISGSNFLVPDDWATIYDLQPLYGVGIDGTGITIAVAGQSQIALSDLQAFRAAAGLTAKDPTIVIPPRSMAPAVETANGDETESDLDLEWAGGIARNANILFVTASATHGNGVDDAIAYVIDNNSAPILSVSYGECEADEPAGYLASEDAIYQQASAEGITVVVSSGDSGATGCDMFLTETEAKHGLAAMYPASSQYVTAVGGTTLQNYGGTYWNPTNNSYGGSALSYIPERTWNDGFQFSSGGGVSSTFAKPSWQSGSGVPADGKRDVPDVAFAASPDEYGYLICGAGWCTNGFRNSTNDLDVIGGTSASTPSFAGLLALVMEKGGGGRLGNINTNLYSLVQVSTNAFHDITYGDNTQICLAGSPDCPTGAAIGYSAMNGYDLTTGLGSVDGFNFAQQWFGDFTLAANTSNLTIQPGSTGAATVSVVPQNNFSGPVTFTCSVDSSLIDVSCSVPSGTVSGAGGSTTVTISAALTAKAPWWKRLKGVPPMSRKWMLLMALVLIVSAGLWRGRKERPLYQLSAYGFSMAGLVAIAVGSVSCGGGGASSGSTSVADSVLILSCNVPAATVGVAYSGGCTATGGTGPYTYSISSGSLPVGVTLSAATGALSGIPTALGSSLLNFKVVDSESTPQTTGANQFTLVVEPAKLTISCQFPAAVVGTDYSGSCTTTGGIPPVNFENGGLPAGLKINQTTGAVTGAPTTPGASTIVIMVADNGGQSATYSQSGFVVSAAPLAMSCTLPGGATGVGYAGRCLTVGGTQSVTFSISSGSLPQGLTLVGEGLVLGVPQIPGTNTFTVQATDHGSPAQTSQINESVAIAVGQLNFMCPLSFAKVGVPYLSVCSASGGTPPFAYSFGSGNLPAGISFNNSTAVLSGVPTTAGTSSFTTVASDNGSPVQKATAQVSSFTVNPTLPLTITCSPLAGNLGVPFYGECSITGGNAPYKASIVSGALPAGLSVFGGLDVGISGNPTALGTGTVTMNVSDSSVPTLGTTAQATATVGPRPTETGVVTVTATSGGITSTTKITVTVP